MAATIVEYILNLKENLTPGINAATGAVGKLEGALKSAGGLIGGLAAGFAIFKGIEFVGAATEAFEKLHQAEAQLENTLKNTGDRAGLTSEDMTSFAGDISHNIKASKADIVELENAFARFGNLSGATFKQAVVMSADMSASLQRDGVDVAKSLARILDAPAQNARLLRQFGITLTKQQRDIFTELDRTGQKAKEQQLIFEMLAERGYGGAARAAAEADPLFRMHKVLEETSLTVGEAATKLITALTPAIIKFLDVVRNGIDWLTKNWEMVKNITVALGAAWVVIGYGLPLLEGMGVAATAALGPLALLAAAIGAVVFAYEDWISTEEEHTARTAQFNDNIAKEENAALDKSVALLEKKGIAHEAAVAKAKDLELQQIENSTQAAIAMSNIANDKGQNTDKYTSQLDILARQQYAARNYEGLVPKKLKSAADSPTAPKPEKTKATGSKNITINVSIAKLGETHINTTNLKESAMKIKDHVVAALTGAVNDFQVVASNS